jgi:hypothetical protein
MYDNVEANGSDQKGAVAQAIIFAAYITSLTILAILAVPFYYFLVVAVVGIPATGLVHAIITYKKHLAWVRQWEADQEELKANPAAIQMQRAVNDDGLPIINL